MHVLVYAQGESALLLPPPDPSSPSPGRGCEHPQGRGDCPHSLVAPLVCLETRGALVAQASTRGRTAPTWGFGTANRFRDKYDTGTPGPGAYAV